MERAVLSPVAPPTMTPGDADALEAFFWWAWPVEDEVVPDYSDVQ